MNRFSLIVIALGASIASPAQVLHPAAVIHSVADLNKSLAFYRDVVGLRPNPEPAFPSGKSAGIQAFTNVPRAAVKSVTLQIPGSELNLVLTQFSGVPQHPLTTRIQDPGVVKLVLRVRDIDKPFATLKNKVPAVYSTGGAPVHPEGPDQRVQAVIVKDPDGFPLELVLANENIKTTAPADSNIVGGWASLVVADEDQSLKFYGDALGFKINKGRLLPPSVLALEGTPTASVTNTGTHPPGSEFTWFVYDFRNIDRKTLPSRLADPGTSGLVFRVENLPAVLRTVTEKGATAESKGGSPVSLDAHTHGVLVKDPSGILIALIE